MSLELCADDFFKSVEPDTSAMPLPPEAWEITESIQSPDNKGRSNTPRLDRLAADEAAVKKMLGLDMLPTQGMTAGEWESYAHKLGNESEVVRSRAKEELFGRSLRMIYRIAASYVERHDPDEDLSLEDHFQNAAESFAKHMGTFNPSLHKTNLATYMSARTIMEIEQKHNKQRLVKLPGRGNGIAMAAIKFSKQYPDIPITERMLTDRTGREPKDIRPVLQAMRELRRSRLINIDDLAEKASIPVDQAILNKVAIPNIQEVMRMELERLTFREREVLEMHFGLHEDPRTPEMGRILSVSAYKIRQIMEHALNRLCYTPGFQALRYS